MIYDVAKALFEICFWLLLAFGLAYGAYLLYNWIGG